MPSMSSPQLSVCAAVPLLLSACLLAGAQAEAAEESAFLACADAGERQARLACLERALEQATVDADKDADKEAAASPGTESPAAARRGTNPAASAESFGRAQARVVNNSEGEAELLDEIAALETQSSGMWVITLASGQVWRQVHPKRFNLRSGEQVRISPSRWGDDYRLTTERLSGFIQVTRLR